MEDFEGNRVNYISIKEAFSIDNLCDFVMSVPGPRIVVANTVLTAAVLANRFRVKLGRNRVMHISTALSPNDRGKVYNNIVEKLDDKNDDDWVLVATSCVDTGVNFSFRSGFRESCSSMSIIQLGGRVNRNGEYEECCNVYDFKIDHENEITTNNPAFNASISVLNTMFVDNKNNYTDCTEAMRREIQEKNTVLDEIEQFENMLNLFEVAKKYRLISMFYHSVVVNSDVIEKIGNEEIISFKELPLSFKI